MSSDADLSSLPARQLLRHDGPLYRQLAAILRAPIVDGTYRVGTELPKEAEIADQRVREEQRAQELDRLAELERFQKLTVGRELKMIALKKEIEELKREVGHLRPARSPERASV